MADWLSSIGRAAEVGLRLDVAILSGLAVGGPIGALAGAMLGGAGLILEGQARAAAEERPEESASSGPLLFPSSADARAVGAAVLDGIRTGLDPVDAARFSGSIRLVRAEEFDSMPEGIDLQRSLAAARDEIVSAPGYAERAAAISGGDLAAAAAALDARRAGTAAAAAGDSAALLGLGALAVLWGLGE